VRLRAGVRFLSTVCSAQKIPRPATSTETDRWVGGPRGLPNNFFAIFKICFMFPGNDFHWRFYYADRQ
jgi:hypothetical protein